MTNRKLGKGYIGKSMSVNAKNAYARGMKPRSYFTSAQLNDLGFHYSYDFFKWLCTQLYILPQEHHHTSAVMNYTKFYDTNGIKYAVQNMNLELLFKIYDGTLTVDEAKHIRGIKYATIDILSSAIGGKSSSKVCANCILCDEILFFTKTQFFYASDQRINIISIEDEIPPQFECDRINHLIKKLLRLKTQCLLKYVNTNQ